MGYAAEYDPMAVIKKPGAYLSGASYTGIQPPPMTPQTQQVPGSLPGQAAGQTARQPAPQAPTPTININLPSATGAGWPPGDEDPDIGNTWTEILGSDFELGPSLRNNAQYHPQADTAVNDLYRLIRNEVESGNEGLTQFLQTQFKEDKGIIHLDLDDLRDILNNGWIKGQDDFLIGFFQEPHIAADPSAQPTGGPGPGPGAGEDTIAGMGLAMLQSALGRVLNASVQADIQQILRSLSNDPIDRLFRQELTALIEQGHDIDYDDILPEMKNVREQHVKMRSGAQRRLMADLAQRGFGAGSDLQVAALQELDSEITTSLGQEFRTIVDAEQERASQRFMNALELSVTYQAQQQQIATSRAGLYLQERLGIAGLEIQMAQTFMSGALGEGGLMLEALGQDMQWAQWMTEFGLKQEQWEWAVQQAEEGNYQDLLNLLVQFLGGTSGGYY